MTDSLKAKVVEATLATIDEVNEYLAPERRLERATSPKLFGAEGGLDSLGLVNFLLSLEARLADDFGRSVTVADERALSEWSSPFATVSSLADYAARLLEEPRRDG